MDVYNSKKITFDEIAKALSKDYESIYVIDSNDDSYVEYITEGEDKNLVIRSSGDDFYSDAIRNCRLFVYPDDQELFLNSFTASTLTASPARRPQPGQTSPIIPTYPHTGSRSTG